jgi:hypothetical protein
MFFYLRINLIKSILKILISLNVNVGKKKNKLTPLYICLFQWDKENVLAKFFL